MDPQHRIALVYATHHYAGGAERHLNQLASWLAEAGHVVTIVCRRHEAPPHPQVRFARLRVRSLGNAWRMWAWARAVERHVAEADYDLVLGLGRTWSQDVVRCGGCHRSWYEAERRHVLGRFERWRRKGALKARVALAIERRAFAPGRFRKVIANSQMIRRDILSRHPTVHEDDVAVIYNGVDPERFRPDLRFTSGAELRRSLGFGAGETVLLFLGAGWARKGLNRLLRALPEVLRARPDVRLLVVGRDKREDDYRSEAERLGLGERVRFLGYRRDAEACFAASDVHVLPTFYDSFAYTVLEAFASGVPVVTTSSAGASELIEPGVHGEAIAADGSPGELARAILPWTEAARRERARPRVRARAEAHSVARCMEATKRLLLEVADERARGCYPGRARGRASAAAPGGVP